MQYRVAAVWKRKRPIAETHHSIFCNTPTRFLCELSGQGGTEIAGVAEDVGIGHEMVGTVGPWSIAKTVSIVTDFKSSHERLVQRPHFRINLSKGSVCSNISPQRYTPGSSACSAFKRIDANSKVHSQVILLRLR